MKLIATDMDGTLLNDHHEISKENIEALRYAESKGVELAIATGRIYYDVDDRLKKAGLDAAIIGTNGATVHTKDGELIYSKFLDKEVLIPFLVKLHEQKLYYSLFTDHGVYRHSSSKAWLEEEIEQNQREQREVDDIIKWLTPEYIAGHANLIIKNTQDIRELTTTIYKFIVFSFDEEKLAKGLHIFDGEERFHIVSSGRGNFEVMHRDATKGNGLEALAKHLNIPLEETMAMGDNFNDAPMLEKAGISVAMGNAEEPIKEMSSMVTKTNTENGVAYAIYKTLEK
jgi:Cof subfamily protein (haloacid dehalogenase superfamily)